MTLKTARVICSEVKSWHQRTLISRHGTHLWSSVQTMHVTRITTCWQHITEAVIIARLNTSQLPCHLNLHDQYTSSAVNWFVKQFVSV